MVLFSTIKKCRTCDLCRNQRPLLQLKTKADVFWVGLSAVRTDVSKDVPLSANTRTGKLVDDIETLLNDISFYRTNIVKCLPLKNTKIRYPSIEEMERCYKHLSKEIDYMTPKIILLLGKQVASFILKSKGIKEFELDEGFNYKPIFIDGIYYLPVHHPSYVLIYKRKYLQNYTAKIKNFLTHYHCQEAIA